MDSFFPDKKLSKWLVNFIKTTIIYFLIITIIPLIIAKTFNAEFLKGGIFLLYIFVFIINLVINLIGYLQLKYLYITLSISLLFSSLLGNIYTINTFAGWEYLASTLIFGLHLTIGLIIGIITELIFRKKDETTQFLNISINKTYKKILIGLIILFLLVLTFITVTLETSMYNEGPEVNNSLDFELKYSEGNHEYEETIIINNNKNFNYKLAYHNLSPEGEIIKDIQKQKDFQISEKEFEDLKNYVIKTNNFLNLPEDLSTNKDILDAPAGFITVSYNKKTFKKGGYYPFDNENFQNISNYLFEILERYTL
ncbi:MAG: hypothetical protein ACQEQE_10570 [Bacillota bacterium]